MLAAPLTGLSTRYPSVVYVNSPSHNFKHKMSISNLCFKNHTEVLSSETIDSDLGIEF